MASTNVTLDDLLNRVIELEKRKYELTVDYLYQTDYTDPSTSSTITLNKPYNEYKLILVVHAWADYSQTSTTLIDVKNAPKLSHCIISRHENSIMRFSSLTTITIAYETDGASLSNNPIIAVIGIK